LLLLAAAARPGKIEAATVDHGLRAEAADEAAMVSAVCEALGVPHAVLAAEWREKPQSAIQERARAERYRLLARWAAARNLEAIATAHHRDDQAETLLMRLNRGAGVRGLGGMRPRSLVPATGELPLLRPLLGWRRDELEQVCRTCGVTAAQDPSNEDARFERVRTRHQLRQAGWLDAEGLAQSAANLRDADLALEWAAEREWREQVEKSACAILYTPAAPREIRRRIVEKAVSALATEGKAEALRGSELDRVLERLATGEKATLRGVSCSGGIVWRFAPAPPRRA
jgi:tRNA(Ile)-lysidine synthase